jgi:hypothetical protein
MEGSQEYHARALTLEETELALVELEAQDQAEGEE